MHFDAVWRRWNHVGRMIGLLMHARLGFILLVEQFWIQTGHIIELRDDRDLIASGVHLVWDSTLAHTGRVGGIFHLSFDDFGATLGKGIVFAMVMYGSIIKGREGQVPKVKKVGEFVVWIGKHGRPVVGGGVLIHTAGRGSKASIRRRLDERLRYNQAVARVHGLLR